LGAGALLGFKGSVFNDTIVNEEPRQVRLLLMLLTSILWKMLLDDPEENCLDTSGICRDIWRIVCWLTVGGLLIIWMTTPGKIHSSLLRTGFY